MASFLDLEVSGNPAIYFYVLNSWIIEVFESNKYLLLHKVRPHVPFRNDVSVYCAYVMRNINIRVLYTYGKMQLHFVELVTFLVCNITRT